MNRINAILGLAMICMMCACSRKKFDTKLLIDNAPKIDKTGPVKYFEPDSGFFYLLTFYKTIEKNPGEDFTFEGLSTYKGSQNSDDNVEGDTTIVQYLALYFFEGGGVVYHTKYKIAPHEKYVPLDLASFGELYQKDKIRKRANKTEFKRYQPLMQGYQAKKINAQKVVKPRIEEDMKSSRDSNYAVRNRQLFNQAVMEKPDSNKVRQIAQKNSRNPEVQPADTSVIKLYLERRDRKPLISLRSKHQPRKSGSKSPIFLLGKHLPGSMGQKEAILIEQIFYLQEVQSAGGRYIPALLSEVFDLGAVTNTDIPFKPLFWFRLEKKENFRDNLPNKKR